VSKEQSADKKRKKKIANVKFFFKPLAARGDVDSKSTIWYNKMQTFFKSRLLRRLTFGAIYAEKE